jgi:hypothetical protein
MKAGDYKLRGMQEVEVMSHLRHNLRVFLQGVRKGTIRLQLGYLALDRD